MDIWFLRAAQHQLTVHGEFIFFMEVSYQFLRTYNGLNKKSKVKKLLYNVCKYLLLKQLMCCVAK